MHGSRIAAIGHYQPARVLTNEDLARMVDTSDEWITSRVGIRTRHIAGPDEPVDELAALLNVSRATAYEAVRSGEIPSIRLGRRIVVPTAPVVKRLNGAA